MLGGQAKDVPEATGTFPDPRARHFWDEAGWTIRAFAPVLGIRGAAWDLYLIYGPEARWGAGPPPAPLFWMHQLRNVDNGPALDPDAFRDRVSQALAALPR